MLYKGCVTGKYFQFIFVGVSYHGHRPLESGVAFLAQNLSCLWGKATTGGICCTLHIIFMRSVVLNKRMDFFSYVFPKYDIVLWFVEDWWRSSSSSRYWLVHVYYWLFASLCRGMVVAQQCYGWWCPTTWGVFSYTAGILNLQNEIASCWYTAAAVEFYVMRGNLNKFLVRFLKLVDIMSRLPITGNYLIQKPLLYTLAAQADGEY